MGTFRAATAVPRIAYLSNAVATGSSTHPLWSSATMETFKQAMAATICARRRKVGTA
jgi:hypothetical protein